MKVLYEKVQLKKNIYSKLEECINQKEVLLKRVSDLKKQLNKELDDVERLENGTLARFFFELVGNSEQKLEKERQEAYEAKTKYDIALYQLNAIENDIRCYKQQLEELKDCEAEYEKAYKLKLKEIGENDTDVLEIYQQISDSKLKQKEIKEAIAEGKKAQQIATQIYNALDSADGWATFDMFSSGIISDLAKYSHLNTAESLIRDLQVQLSRFRTELTDISIDTDIQISIDGFLKFADFIFDNIFTDWTVRERISGSISQIKNTSNRIHCIIRDLEDLLNEEIKRENDLNTKLERIVVGL